MYGRQQGQVKLTKLRERYRWVRRGFPQCTETPNTCRGFPKCTEIRKVKGERQVDVWRFPPMYGGQQSQGQWKSAKLRERKVDV